MKRGHDVLVFAAVCELAGEARATHEAAAELAADDELAEVGALGELAGDLVAIGVHLAKVATDELATFHSQHDRTLPAAPAWMLKGGAA